ncbi:MAG: FKBP-type peptidyl-prolyl cis-trans isomerase [Nitrosomonadales bacterium]|nr:FKBP-type peptidyl-prolyl cis-trans isomerase [Nitrosomonadales bacterium]
MHPKSLASRLCLFFLCILLPIHMAFAEKDEAAPEDVPEMSVTDTKIGTGFPAGYNDKVKVVFTYWLYSSTAPDFKGKQAGSSGEAAGSSPDAKVGNFKFKLYPMRGIIGGLTEAVNGMRVGGKRTVILPSSMAFGAKGEEGKVPPNSALIFEIELTRLFVSAED